MSFAADAHVVRQPAGTSVNPMDGTVAVTDFGWYTHLRAHPELEEVNFWKPSAHRPLNAPEFSPFFFKLKAPYNAICGFGYFARYSRLPDWLAWESFGLGNGCNSLQELRERIGLIRDRIRFQAPAHAEIGCVLIVQPTFFNEADWVVRPADWPNASPVRDRFNRQVRRLQQCWLARLPHVMEHRQSFTRDSAKARFALQSWMRTAAHVPLPESIACPRLRQLTSGHTQAKGHMRYPMASSCGQTSTGSLTKGT